METIKNIRPSSVKLNQGMTGKCGWEIRAEEDDPVKLIAKIEELHKMMGDKFANGME